MKLRECLLDQGADVPALPSYQAYAEQFLADEGVYDLYFELGPAVTKQYRGVCPNPMDTFGFNG